MALDPRKVIEIAKAEIGYLEKKSNSNLDSKTANAGSNNYTKYGRDLDAIGFYNGKKNGVAWCDQFVDWCFVQAFGKAIALEITFQPKKAASNCGAGCQYSRSYYKNNGRLFDKPEPGDQIFFWNSGKTRVSHTGLVIAVDSTYVHTVEGNTSGASGVVANGGGVKQKKYKLSYNRLAGYGRPAWELAGVGVEQLGNAAQAAGEAKPVPGDVTVAKGSWHLRTGPGTEYPSAGIVRGGEVLQKADLGEWLPVKIDDTVCFISPKAVTG